jgi:hypothetical protein
VKRTWTVILKGDTHGAQNAGFGARASRDIQRQVAQSAFNSIDQLETLAELPLEHQAACAPNVAPDFLGIRTREIASDLTEQ